jgi:hypothetical protein
MIPKFIKNFFKKEKEITLSKLELDFDNVMNEIQEETDKLMSIPYSSVGHITTSPPTAFTQGNSWVTISASGGAGGGGGAGYSGSTYTYTISDDWITFGPNYEPLNLKNDDFEEICKLANTYPCMHDALENLKITYELVKKQGKLPE